MLKTFKSRLLTILVVINLFVLLLGGASYYFLGEVGHRLESFTQGIYARLEISNRLREAADARALAVRNLALLSEPTMRRKQVDEFDRRQAETLKAVEALQSAVASAEIPAEVRSKVAVIANVEARYRPVAAAIVQQLQDGRREEAIAQIDRVCTPTLLELTTAIHDYGELTQERTKAFVVDTEATTRLEKTTMLATVTAAVVAA
jgi:methyl-accepting chemotaxis protein-1 (serine sensor receptor)